MSPLGWPDGAVKTGAPVTFVLVPSLGTTARLFEDLAHELRRRVIGSRVLRTDLPGHGSGPVTAETSIESLADDVAALIDGARAERVVVVGVSMGGAIALEVARRHPAGLVGFVQMNSGARFGSPEGWRDLIDQAARSGTERLAASSKAGWFTEEFGESEVAQALLADLGGIDDDSYVACCRALATYDGDHDLDLLAVPALLLGTADDRATPSAVLRGLAERLPHGSFVELPTGGHLSVAEHAGEVGVLIAEWFESSIPA